MFDIVTRGEDTIVNASRQSGKTEAVAGAAYVVACLGGFVLVISPSDEQSMEFHRRVVRIHHENHLCAAAEDPTKHGMELISGGRILAVSSNEKTVRSKSAVDLLVADEASRISDDLIGATEAMLAVRGGKVVLLSTPFGQRGFFWREWTGQGNPSWRRHLHTWRDCPRITPEFIDKQRIKYGELWVEQEYECQFNAIVGGVFDVTKFDGLIDPAFTVEEEWR